MASRDCVFEFRHDGLGIVVQGSGYVEIAPELKSDVGSGWYLWWMGGIGDLRRDYMSCVSRGICWVCTGSVWVRRSSLEGLNQEIIALQLELWCLLPKSASEQIRPARGTGSREGCKAGCGAGSGAVGDTS